MLKTNLATRPFYNERAVQFVLGALAVLVLAVSAFNAFELIRLTENQRTLGSHAVDAEREAARLRSEAATIRAQINARELEVVANAAREANSIIDRRAFSWSDLFDELEHTLPDDVRITAIDPSLSPQGQFVVNIAVQARRSEDLDAFIEALEKTGSFRDVITPAEETNEQGLLVAVVRGVYIRTGERVADNLQSETLTQRVLREHRRVVVPLAVALGVNVVVYIAAVYPLSQRVANIQQRDRTAEEQLLAARRDHAQATGTLTGKDRAAAELATFYKDVLPQDLAGARRLTQLRLAQLARESNLKFVRATFEPVNESKRTLTQLRIDMELAGTYSDVRAFIHQLETAPEFVVVDNIELGQGAEGGPLSVTLHLSTYYRETASRDVEP